MKKKILFVMNNLSCGGAEKSLVSLLETFDYEKYEIDLFLMCHEGLFLSRLPKQVNLLRAPKYYQLFNMPIKSALLKSIKVGRFDIAFSRVKAGLISRSEKNRTRRDQKIWKYISRSIAKIKKKYDIAIGYLEISPIYFVVEKVNSSKKIGWIHTHYSNSGMDRKIDNPYFSQLEQLVTVSDECAKSLKGNFPQIEDRIKIINNIISPKTIKKLSECIDFDGFFNDKENIKIVTIARLSHVKGIDLAVKACKLLLENGFKIRWYILGSGTLAETQDIEQLIRVYGLDNNFILLGNRENPYPYLKNSEIYVQPSRYEGKSIAIEEAKILCKPIVVTNFSSSSNQIKNNFNGLIVEMCPSAIYMGIKSLLEDSKLKNTLTKNLLSEDLGTENEVQKLYEICS